MLINFTLAPIEQIVPWSEPGSRSLHWFGLTYGEYWIRAGEAALFFDPARTDEIAQALDRMSSDPALRDDLRDAAARRAVMFTPRQMARRHLAAYRRACRAAAPQHPIDALPEETWPTIASH